MSSPSSEVILVASLRGLLPQLNFHFGMFIFTFGIVGNSLNILVLSGLTSWILSGVTVDLLAIVNLIRNVRGFILFASRFATFWLIILATFDRWLLSSVDAGRRQMRSMKNALRDIAVIVSISIILHSQSFYCYKANRVGTPLKCFTRNFGCRLMNGLTFSVVAILVPLLLITIFALLTISTMRKTRGRVGPMTMIAETHPKSMYRPSIHHHHHRSKKVDQCLLMMLFIQVILLALFTLPLTIQRLYATLTMDVPKSSSQSTIEDFIYQIALICTYFAARMPFYVIHVTQLEALEFNWN